VFPLFGEYIHIRIARANAKKLEEVLNMSKSAVTIDQVLERSGLKAKWRAEGKAEVARNLIKIGLSLEKVAQVAELEIETVKSLIQP
jgi:predicted transposase YdaD